MSNNDGWMEGTTTTTVGERATMTAAKKQQELEDVQQGGSALTKTKTSSQLLQDDDNEDGCPPKLSPSSTGTPCTTPENLLFSSTNNSKNNNTATPLTEPSMTHNNSSSSNSSGSSNGFGHNNDYSLTDLSEDHHRVGTSLTHDSTRIVASSAFPDAFHQSPEPLFVLKQQQPSSQDDRNDLTTPSSPSLQDQHHYHSLGKIREDKVSNDGDFEDVDDDDYQDLKGLGHSSPSRYYAQERHEEGEPYFTPHFTSTKIIFQLSSFSSYFNISSLFKRKRNSGSPKDEHDKQAHPFFGKDYNGQNMQVEEEFAVATRLGFWALLAVTCANYVLSPMRDAVALQVGVQHIPKLTLASSVLAFMSSVPIGWLFEAPDPGRRKVWKRMGLTRGETQGTSLALFYRFFALSVLSYAVGFQIMEKWIHTGKLMQFVTTIMVILGFSNATTPAEAVMQDEAVKSSIWRFVPLIMGKLGSVMYIAFFLVVHLMKLHSISLVWGVTTEAMEYEDVARKQQQELHPLMERPPTKTRLQRLGMVGFGGTLGGLLGSCLASSMAHILHLPGLLVVSALLLEIAAELSIELGRIMRKHWEEQQVKLLFKSTQDLTSLVDPSIRRSGSLGSMKRVSSGNSIFATQQQHMKRVASGNSLAKSKSVGDFLERPEGANNNNTTNGANNQNTNGGDSPPVEEDDNTFTQRLLRGIKTILRSRLLMAIFTYNALFASTTVLLSFERAELVANRKLSAAAMEAADKASSVSADTAFLANINMASSIAVFAMQASGAGAIIAQKVGPRGSLSLMPLIRLLGVLSLAWWHHYSRGQPPNLILFLMLDECTRVVNLAIAKPVRESLWRGLSNEARYEAKPIVDTLANRWGAGSASFCVSMFNKALLWAGMMATTSQLMGDGSSRQIQPQVFGLPPVLFLCLLVAAWWAMVSVDLGHIRRKIDIELKKHQ